jgi:hypothetical protein
LSAHGFVPIVTEMPDVPPLRWYETPIWLVAQLVEIGVLTWVARALAPDDLTRGAAIVIGVVLVALLFGANLLALRWLRARDRTG